MSGRWFCLVCGLLLLLLSGCGPSAHDRLVGHWDGQFDINQQEVERQSGDSKSPLANPLAQMMLGGMKAATLKLHFDKTGQMEMTFKIGPLDQSTRGTWEVVRSEGDQVTIQSQDERGNQKQFELTFTGPDEFVMRPPEGGDAVSLGTIRFRRAAQP
ncbi:MAG: hypothetical protein J5I93_20160 [Pirellulaceae bacterium]|nr:hypothetical protein [Pirellulaceae bacterium]